MAIGRGDGVFQEVRAPQGGAAVLRTSVRSLTFGADLIYTIGGTGALTVKTTPFAF